MKKMIACLVALLLIFALYGCGGAEEKFNDVEASVEQVADKASVPSVVEDVEPEAPLEQVVQEDSTPVVQDNKNNNDIVYITDTGTKYHKGSCRWLKDSKIEISKEDATRKGYEPCGTCH